MLVQCPGCGSALWDGTGCGACGRLASETSPRAGPRHPTRAQRVGAAALKGAIGGGFAGYLGGRPFNPGAVGQDVLLVAAVGAVVGVVLVVAATGGRLRETGAFWAFVPAVAALGALVFGLRRLLGWVFGFGVAQWAEGYLAAGVGAVAGAVLAAGIVFLASRPRA